MMAEYKSKSGGKPADEWVPDHLAIINGDPLDGSGEYDPCPEPVDGKLPAPGKVYPNGPWERRCLPDGRLFWWHAEYVRRSRMRCYQRRVMDGVPQKTARELARQPFNDPRGGK